LTLLQHLSTLELILPALFSFSDHKAAEIERLVEIGNELVKLFTKLEQDMGEKHKEYLKSEAFLKANEGAKGDFAAKVAEAEAAGTNNATRVKISPPFYFKISTLFV